MTFNKMLGISAIAGLMVVSGLGAATAAPPPPPNFQFGIQLGNNGGYDPGPSDSCADEHEIAYDLRSQGYRHLSLVDDSGDMLTFDATRKSRLYELEVDSCSGEILSKTRIYHY